MFVVEYLLTSKEETEDGSQTAHTSHDAVVHAHVSGREDLVQERWS